MAITAHVVTATDDHSKGWARAEYVAGQDALNISTDSGQFSVPMSAGRPLRECLERLFPES